MVMKLVNIAEAKAKLSEYLELAAEGTEVLICRHNKPVARLTPVADAVLSDGTPRPVGLASGTLTIPDSFFEPLPTAIEDDFYGDTAVAAVSRVAEAPAHDAGSAKKRR